MRYLVTPKFSDKVTAAGGRVLEAAAKALSRIEGLEKDEILQSALVLDGSPEIFALRDKDYRVFISFGSDDEGEYALVLDLLVHGGSDGIQALRTNDPRLNMMLDPKRNMMIDPSRNMMIDPSRNMMIDPNRNMMIDPRRNMLIDPNRNMMIDVRRNMMLDPQRNFAIDPRRNWQINPSQNSAWGGPLLYDLQGQVNGFAVRANEKVGLLFKPNGDFAGSIIKAGDRNLNFFDKDGGWSGFFVYNGANGYNQFDLQRRWVGFLVGDPELASV